MSDELVLNGKTYVSSKRAAESTGYARDYIGQLSRGGLIESERVGGLWYVSMESLQNYEKNAEIAKSFSPTPSGSKEAESMLSFEGKDYISASRASKLIGYNQDYIGQLARGGKIPSKQIGNRWYVDRDALVKHKSEKDALLAAVQAEAVGLKQSAVVEKLTTIKPPEHILVLPQVNYMHESADLMPLIPEKKQPLHFPVSNFNEIRLHAQETELTAPADALPVPSIPHQKPTYVIKRPSKSNKSRYAVISASVLTIILVLSIGLTTMRGNASFARIRDLKNISNMTAGAASAVTVIGDAIENIVSQKLSYTRGN